MARRVEVVLMDDLDGSKADETVRFGLDGVMYEIDLNSDNADKLREALAGFLGGARRTGSGKVVNIGSARGARSSGSTVQGRERSRAIRDWAAEHGCEVAGRGRIPETVIAAYDAKAPQMLPGALRTTQQPAPVPQADFSEVEPEKATKAPAKKAPAKKAATKVAAAG